MLSTRIRAYDAVTRPLCHCTICPCLSLLRFRRLSTLHSSTRLSSCSTVSSPTHRPCATHLFFRAHLSGNISRSSRSRQSRRMSSAHSTFAMLLNVDRRSSILSRWCILARGPPSGLVRWNGCAKMLGSMCSMNRRVNTSETRIARFIMDRMRLTRCPGRPRFLSCQEAVGAEHPLTSLTLYTPPRFKLMPMPQPAIS